MTIEGVRCVCCGLRPADLRALFPHRARIVRGHPTLPEGKAFPYARLMHGGVEVLGHWPAYFHGRRYWSERQHVELIEESQS